MAWCRQATSHCLIQWRPSSMSPCGVTWPQLHQPWLWCITGGYLVKRWFLPAAARARGQSNDLNREILASNLFNCCKEVINAPPVPSISRCIHIVYRHKNVSEYQWSNFIYNCMSTFLHYVHYKDALLDGSAPGGERCESLTRVDEIEFKIQPFVAPQQSMEAGRAWHGGDSPSKIANGKACILIGLVGERNCCSHKLT